MIGEAPNRWKPYSYRQKKLWDIQFINLIKRPKIEFKKPNLSKIVYLFSIIINIPYKKILDFSIKLILIAGSFAFASTVYLNYKAIQFIEDRRDDEFKKIRKLIDDDYKELKNQADNNKERMDYIEAHATITKHQQTRIEATIANGQDRGKKIFVEKDRIR
jgi:hypothetical protein